MDAGSSTAVQFDERVGAFDQRGDLTRPFRGAIIVRAGLSSCCCLLERLLVCAEIEAVKEPIASGITALQLETWLSRR